MKFLTNEEIRLAVPMPEAITAVKEAFIQLSSGRAVVPPRTSLEIPEFGTTSLVMSAYLPGSKRLGLKLISLCRANPGKGLPFAQAVIIVMDAETGVPLAVMDGTYLTALRTGAASGAATDALARKDARVAAVFGAGVQGRTQLEAVCAVRPIEKSYIFDVDAQRSRAFSKEMTDKLSLDVSVATSADILSEADVICTATTSSTPVFLDADLKQGVHINAIGSYKPYVREVPAETVSRAKVVVDQRDACLAEAGDLLIPIEQGLIDRSHIYAELGEILSKLKPGRTSANEITLFKSVGNAVQDLAVAALVLKNKEKA